MGRFSGSIGEEYRLFSLAVPWHDEFQKCIAAHVGMWAGFRQPTLWARRGGDPAVPCPQFVFEVVEIGCGTGFTTELLLGSYPYLNITALDNEPIMIQQAQELFAGEERVTFQLADALEALQAMLNASVDAVASAYVLHNLEPELREQILEQVVRVLKPGGLFINGDKYARDDPPQQAADLAEQVDAFRVFDQKEEDWSDLREEWTIHYLEDETIAWKEGEAVAQLQELGMKDVRVMFRRRMEAIVTATKPW